MNATLTPTAVKPTTLEIKGQSYHVETFTPEAEGYSSGVRLEKRDGTTYDLVDGPHGAECDCPDFTARHEGLRTSGCKHVRAAREAGLLTSPDPTVRPIDNLPDAIAYLERVGPVVALVAEHFGSEAEAPTPTPERKPDLRTVHGATIDMDLWLNGPRPTPAPAPCCDSAEVEPCAACSEPADPDDDFELNPDEWEWSDEADEVWTLAPAESARLSLHDLIAFEVDRLRAMGSEAGELMADHMGELLTECEILDARDASTFRDRRDAYLDARAVLV